MSKQDFVFCFFNCIKSYFGCYDSGTMNTLGIINELWRYPFKSMGGQRLESCMVTSKGVVGDRGWAVRDSETGKLGSGKRMPALLMCNARYLSEPTEGAVGHVEISFPDGSTVRTDQEDASERLSSYVGKPVTLESSNGEHFDDLQLSMQTSASMKELEKLLVGSEIHHKRFRHNFAIQTPNGIEGYAEMGWVGNRIKVGEVCMEIVKPIPRCPMVSAAQPGLDGDQRILKTILSEVDRCVGVYATTEMSGVIRVGDCVEKA